MKYAERFWAVAGFTQERAWQIMQDIKKQYSKEVLKSLETPTTLQIWFTDNTILYWIPENKHILGERIGKMWCDKSIKEDFYMQLLPCYFGKREDIIWLDS